MTEDEIVKLLKDNEGFLTGHFCLTSGLHSDTYFQCAKLYQYPDVVEELAKELAKNLSALEFDTIVAPAIGAVIFGYEVAKQMNKRYLFVERKDETMQLRRGYTIKRGERVVIIEDVITTARTILETKEAIKEFEPQIVGIGCIVDRSQGKTGLEINSLLHAEPVLYNAYDCPMCRAGIEIVKPGSRGV